MAEELGYAAGVTDQVIRRGSFTSVKQLVQKIDEFVKCYNPKTKPFAWTATAEEILKKIQRLCEKLTG